MEIELILVLNENSSNGFGTWLIFCSNKDILKPLTKRYKTHWHHHCDTTLALKCNAWLLNQTSSAYLINLEILVCYHAATLEILFHKLKIDQVKNGVKRHTTMEYINFTILQPKANSKHDCIKH